MNEELREIERCINKEVHKGTVTIKDGTYTYFYPTAKAIGDQMTVGDKVKIAKMTGMSMATVSSVLSGARWNALILIEARKFAKRNVEMGWV